MPTAAEAEPPAEGPRAIEIDIGFDELRVGGLVRRVRRVADLSQRELAARVRVSPGLIGAIETGRTSPSLATFQRILRVAGFRLVACDAERTVVVPMETWDGVVDGAGRRFPAHLDTIVDPVFGEWWADVYGLLAPPETFRRSRAWREWQRKQSQWEVRVKQLRWAPQPRRPRRETEWQDAT